MGPPQGYSRVLYYEDVQILHVAYRILTISAVLPIRPVATDQLHVIRRRVLTGEQRVSISDTCIH